jgi:hypothetical protein
MTPIKIAVRMTLIGLLLALLPFVFSVRYDKRQVMTPTAEAQSEVPPPTKRKPFYIPPQLPTSRRGAPKSRVGGGTRGDGDSLTLAALAPDHVGLTAQAQPSLFWYLSSATTSPIEVVIMDPQKIDPLLVMRFHPPPTPGIQRVRLAEYDVSLAIGVPYRWSIALIPDPTQRSKDIVARGDIERIALPEALHTRLAQAREAEKPALYAEASLWYDALTALSDLIEATPRDTKFRQQRAALLEQVGLSEAATYDKQFLKVE